VILKGAYAAFYVLLGLVALVFCISENLRRKKTVPKETIDGLIAKLLSIPLAKSNNEITVGLEDIVTYVRQNEGCLGIETLCDHLVEYDFPLSQELYCEIESLAIWYGADLDRVTCLRALVRASASVGGGHNIH